LIPALSFRPSALAAQDQKQAQAVAQGTQTSAANEADLRTRLEQKITALKAKVRDKRLVRVIVGLRGNFQAADELLDKSASEAQRESVSRAQDALLSKLLVPNLGSIKKLRTIPYLVVEVDELGLEQLQSLDEVVSVTEDEHDAPALAESTALIGAPQAWNLGFTGAGQTVAILDTGVDNDHSFLAGRVVSEGCFSTASNADNTNSVCPGGLASSTAAGSADNLASNISGFDHGTHVAGIAAGRGQNLSGVAKDANIIAIQVFSRFNDQADCGTAPAPCLRSFRSDQIEALERVLDLSDNFQIAAVNMSLGGGNFTATCDNENPAYTEIISQLRARKIATVIASGNGGNKNGIAFPACISKAISVGSTGDGSTVNGITATQDVVVSTSQSASFLQLLAPGRWINSSVPSNLFGNKSGTSMAAPHVTGAIAALKEKSPGASVDDLLLILKQTGVAVTDQANNITKRRINLGGAIDGLCTPNSYTLTPGSASFGFQGGTGAIQVTAQSGSCIWQARSNASWITVLNPAPDTGNGVVSYQVLPLPFFSFGPRVGTITVAGRKFTVVQQGLFF
jgi:subtilisin family serine protease